MRHPSAYRPRCPSSDGTPQRPNARDLFTAWRSSYDNGVSSRSLRRLPPADRDVHAAGGAFRHADARGGFRPANAAHTLPHFFPTCDVQEANLFIQFLLSPSLLPVAAPIALRSARSAIVLRASGRFAPHSFPLHGGEVPTGLFFIFRFCPSSPLRPPPFRHPPPWRCPVRRSAAVPHDPPPRSPRNPDCAAVSASIHPLHSPHRPCPKIIVVLRSASL